MAIMKSKALTNVLADLSAFNASIAWGDLTKFEIAEIQERFVSMTRIAMRDNAARDHRAKMTVGVPAPQPKGSGPFGSTYTGD